MACPPQSEIVGSECTCGADLVLTSDGCAPASGQVATAIAHKIVKAPSHSGKKYLCYYKQQAGSYSFIDQSVDFRFCTETADAFKALFISGHNTQNLLIHSNVRLGETGDGFLGVFASFQKELTVQSSRIYLSVFATSIASLTGLTTLVEELRRADVNFTVITAARVERFSWLAFQSTGAVQGVGLSLRVDMRGDNVLVPYLFNNTQSSLTLANMELQVNSNTNSGSAMSGAVLYANGDVTLTGCYFGGYASIGGRFGSVFVVAGYDKRISLALRDALFMIELDYQSSAHSGVVGGVIYAVAVTASDVRVGATVRGKK